MKISDFLKMYGDCELKDLFKNFENYVIPSKKGKIYSADEVEDGKTLYCLDHYGAVFEVKYSKDMHWLNKAIKQGNMFWDEQSAKEEAKRRKVCHVVEKYSCKFSEEEWRNQGIVKSFPYYDYNFKKISIGNCTFFRHKNLYFKSKEDIEKAIEEVGKENFIKYFLGVEL